jgi:PKD repeat protein
LLINADYNYQAGRTKQTFNFNLALGGGVPPYEVHVDWGDGKTSHIVRTEDTTFTITHTYDEPKEYVVLVTVTDAKGIVSTMQLLAVTNDPNITGAAAVGSDNVITALIANLKEWLWVIGPIYIVIILMVFSYWIGEQQVYWRLMAGRRVGHKGKGR